MHRLSLCAWGYVVPILAAIGCAAHGGPDSSVQGAWSAERSRGPLQESTFTPVLTGTAEGLEVQSWVIAGGDGEIGRVLARYTQYPVPMNVELRRAWSEQGLRVFAVPLEQLADLQDSVRVVGGVQRQWLGQAPFWAEVVRGPVHPAGAAIVSRGSVVVLPTGGVRLLARAWSVPIAVADRDGEMRGAAALHFEFVPQHFELGGEAETTFVPKRSRSLEEQGLVFRELHTSLTVLEGYAFAVVPERPGVEWDAAAAEPAEEAGLSTPGVAVEATSSSAVGAINKGAGSGSQLGEGAEPDPYQPPAFGPPAPVVPTLGEALLASRREHRSLGDFRAMILLIPRASDQFRLIR